MAFKRRVVSETLEPGATVAAVARRHGLNANMVFQWRRDRRFGPGPEAASFLPVEVCTGAECGTDTVAVPPIAEPETGTNPGTVEIALSSGHRLILNGGFDTDAVLRLARGLSS